MIIPYELDIAFARRPYVNWLLVTSIVIVFILQIAFLVSSVQSGDIEYQQETPFDAFILGGWDPVGLIGHMWLHGGILHLIGNMLFLWVFGNAICCKVGNLLYFPAYIFVGLCAAVTYLVLSDGRAIGASGAINGIVGMYLILYPENEISCFYWFGIWWHGSFEVSGFWIIIYWFAWDILGVALGGGGVAYWAHIGGFLGGIILATVLLAVKVIRMDRDEGSLYSMLGINIGYQEPSGSKRTYTDADVQEMKLRLEMEAEERQNNTLGSAGVQSDQKPGEFIRKKKQHQRLSASDIVSSPLTPAAACIVRKPEFRGDEFVRYYCPCGQKLKAPLEYMGRMSKCPRCNKPVAIPEA